MIPAFGAHYRAYRLIAALRRLRDMPPGTTVTFAWASRLLGVREAHIRALVRRYAPGSAADGATIGVALLRHVLRQAYEARKQT